MKLRELRIEKGFTIKKLSELSGVPTRTIEQIQKTGVSKTDTAMKLARALNVSLDELCEFELKAD